MKMYFSYIFGRLKKPSTRYPEKDNVYFKSPNNSGTHLFEIEISIYIHRKYTKKYLSTREWIFDE